MKQVSRRQHNNEKLPSMQKVNSEKKVIILLPTVCMSDKIHRATASST